MSGLPPQVIFRAKDRHGNLQFYVAYLFIAPDGQHYAVLSQETAEGSFLPGSTPRLDPSLLVERHDNNSEEPFYLYSGVIDVPLPEFQKPRKF